MNKKKSLTLSLLLIFTFLIFGCKSKAGKLTGLYEKGLDIMFKVKTDADLQKNADALRDLIKDIKDVKKSVKSGPEALALLRQSRSTSTKLGKMRKELLITLKNAYLKFRNNRKYGKIIRRFYQSVKY